MVNRYGPSLHMNALLSFKGTAYTVDGRESGYKRACVPNSFLECTFRPAIQPTQKTIHLMSVMDGQSCHYCWFPDITVFWNDGCWETLSSRRESGGSPGTKTTKRMNHLWEGSCFFFVLFFDLCQKRHNIIQLLDTFLQGPWNIYDFKITFFVKYRYFFLTEGMKTPFIEK